MSENWVAWASLTVSSAALLALIPLVHQWYLDRNHSYEFTAWGWWKNEDGFAWAWLEVQNRTSYFIDLNVSLAVETPSDSGADQQVLEKSGTMMGPSVEYKHSSTITLYPHVPLNGWIVGKLPSPDFTGRLLMDISDPWSFGTEVVCVWNHDPSRKPVEVSGSGATGARFWRGSLKSRIGGATMRGLKWFIETLNEGSED